MTSWIRKTGTASLMGDPNAEKDKSMYYHTTDDNVAAELLNIFYSFVYANSSDAPLKVYDTSNPLMPNRGFYATTFEDISGLQFVDTQSTRFTSLNKKSMQVLQFIHQFPVGALSHAATQVFKLRKERHEEVVNAINTMYVQGHTTSSKVATLTKVDYDRYDIGIYIRSNSKKVPVQPYVAAIRAFQKKYQMEKVGVFLMLDDMFMVDELKKVADPSWTLYVAAPAAPKTGSSSSAAQIRAQQEKNVGFLANISILQNIPHTITSMGSAVGKFLFLTCDDVQKFKTIDTATFSPFVTL